MTRLRKPILILLKEDILEWSNPNTRFLYMVLFKTIYILLVANMNYELAHYSLNIFNLLVLLYVWWTHTNRPNWIWSIKKLTKKEVVLIKPNDFWFCCNCAYDSWEKIYNNTFMSACEYVPAFDLQNFFQK